MVELMTDTLKNSGPHLKPDPDPEENQSKLPAGYDRHAMVSCNGCSPPPSPSPIWNLLPPISPHGHQPCQVVSRVSQETHLHLELGASPQRLRTDTADQPSPHWTTTVCLFVFHITCIMSPWTWVGCCWGRMVHRGIKQLFCMYVFLVPHSLAIFFAFDLLDKRPKNPPWQHWPTSWQRTHKKKGYAKCWDFFMIVIAILI